MIIGSELGIGYDPDQHAAYAASWIQILENQPLEIFRAAADGEKIHTYLQSLQQQQSVSYLGRSYRSTNPRSSKSMIA
jgi:antirestriction protein ArdC